MYIKKKIPFNKIFFWLRKHLFWVKIVVFIGCVIYIVIKLSKIVNLYQRANVEIEHAKNLFSNIYFVVALFLVFINWGIEAYKWKILTSTDNKLTFYQSFKIVLAGLGLASIVPLGIGDYIGRLNFYNYKNRRQTLIYIWLGHQCQFLATTFFASLSFIFFYSNPNIALNLNKIDTFLKILSFILTIFLLLLIVFLNKAIKALSKLLGHTFNAVSVSFKKRFLTLLLSFTRYFVFIFQFYLIFLCFNFESDFLIITSAICLVFFLKSILPAFNFFSDLGVREFASIYIFDKLLANEVTILAVSLTIWCMNIFLPSIAGIFLILINKRFGFYKKI